MVTDDIVGANVLLSVLLDRGLVGVRAGGGDAGDFDPRPEPAAGDAAEGTDPTPASS